MAVTTVSRPVGIPQNPVLMLEGKLRPETRALFRQLLHVLNPPIDAPNLIYALSGAVAAVKAYGTTLRQPSIPFVEQLSGLESLLDEAEEILRDTNNHWLESALWRRLSNNPAWALVLAINETGGDKEECVAAGVEILHSLFAGTKFAKNHAARLRIAMHKPHQPGEKRDWLPRYSLSRREADNLFEAECTSGYADFVLPAHERIRAELTRSTHYATTRHRQAVLDSRHLTSRQRETAGAYLRKQIELGDESAMLILLAERSGIGTVITKDIPIAGKENGDDWVMQLDIEAGVIKTDLSCLVKGYAKAPSGASCFRAACKVSSIPLPEFLAIKLREKWHERKHASCIDDLLVNANVNGRMLLVPGSASGIAPSVGKFLESAAPYAIESGVDRLAAALLSNDYSIIPNSKLYYCHVTHDEIWDAASVVYESLGWGRPVPFIDGVGIGSSIVPTRKAIEAWFKWMRDQVDSHRPGRHCSLERLVEFHNVYAFCCASILMFCLAAREVRELRFHSQSLSPNVAYTTFVDKRGKTPRDIPVTVCMFARKMLLYWECHLRALKNRLAKAENVKKDFLRYVDRILGAGNVGLFFMIDKRFSPRTLGSRRLASWWPEQYGFSTDFGRHFWETELRVAGLPSSVVDRHLRHVMQGMEPSTSTDDETLNKVLERISKAQDGLLEVLGCCPISGLARK